MLSQSFLPNFGQGPFPKIAGIENVILQCVKNMDFALLFSDSAIQVSYKFEMLFFKMALVIKQYRLKQDQIGTSCVTFGQK